MTRLEEELALLRRRFADLDFHADGQWVRIPAYRIPIDMWVPRVVEIAFRIPAQVATPPYGFYARPHVGEDDLRPALRAATGAGINNYTYPAADVPFGQGWGLFSWAPMTWHATEPITNGATMLEFARSIATRCQEGP